MLEHQPVVLAVEDLEPLPQSVTALVPLVASAEPEIDKIVEVINFDQALTATLLRVANSAASASVHPVTTAARAVMRLGTGRVLSIAVGSAVSGQMKQALPGYGYSERSLWRHSVAAALAAECLPKFTEVEIPAESFTAALLHDIGKLAMSRFLDPEVSAYLHRAREEGHRSCLEAEVEVLGVHHGEVGELMARHWKLPESISAAICFHHSPDGAKSVICDAVHLSEVVASRIGEGLLPDEVSMVPGEGAMQRFGLDEPALERLGVAVSERFEEVSSQYG